MAGSVYSSENEVFANLVFYGTVILIKVAMMSNLTSFYRLKDNSYASIEDAQMVAPKDLEKRKKMLRRHDHIERIRRAHLNDLENVIPFVLLSLLYVGTNPDPVMALWHFRIFVVARFVHSFVYVNGIRQPFRFIFYFIGQCCIFSMVFHNLAYFY